MRTANGNGLTRANERAEKASVAIDGSCARKKAGRMSVRKKRTKQGQYGWHRGMQISSRRTEISVFRAFILIKNTKGEHGLCKRKSPIKFI